jgi:hypothetical protein
MDSTLHAQIESFLSQLNALIRRGCDLRDALADDPSNDAAATATRLWQQDCGVIINELSGGSKAHWLARSFSEAFLLRSESGRAVEGAAPDEIVKRLLDVLEQAVVSLSRKEDVSMVSTSKIPPPRQFEFVHDTELRPVLERAYRDSLQILERRDYDGALRTSCGILEAIVTDALEHKGPDALVASGAPTGKIADWPFETRLMVAERSGLIHRGWARLPATALTYRDGDDHGAAMTISEGDARKAAQVLRVVMRDLDPGR